MVDYRCKKCGKLLFKADIEYGVIKTKCPDCGVFLEVNSDQNKIEAERTWKEFKVDCGFDNLVIKYDADKERVQFAEEYAPRIYALNRRLYPDARIRFKVSEDSRRTYFAVYIEVDNWEGIDYMPYHHELIGFFDSTRDIDYELL